jgi:hypothetical protein
MKKQLAFLGGFVLLLSACSSSKSSINRTDTKAVATAGETNAVNGVWRFVRNVGGAATSPDKKIKLIRDKHWMFSQFDPATNITLYHHGGTYLLDGNSYAETIDYANETTGGLIGQTYRYNINVAGDTMTLTGPFSEVWARVK